MSADKKGHRAVIVEYWLASLFGRVWLRLRPGLRPTLGELPGGAMAVAHGSLLPAGRLLRVQDFAVRIWWRSAIVAMLLIAPVIAVAAMISPGPWGAGVPADVALVFAGLAAESLAQMILLRYRSHRTDAFVLRNLPDWDTMPLPGGSPGLPRRSDFWLATGIAAVVFAVMVYASIPRHLRCEMIRWRTPTRSAAARRLVSALRFTPPPRRPSPPFAPKSHPSWMPSAWICGTRQARPG